LYHCQQDRRGWQGERHHDIAQCRLPAAATSDELAAARATYNATCVRCHKEDGSGGTVEFGEGETLKVPI
jgi:mono/diheme cytochrome c family protein